MSEAKHTPGPWRVGNIRRQAVDQRLQTMWEIPIHAGTGNCHTIVYGGGPAATRSDEESVLANARLIAAAPELLETLKWALDEVAYSLCQGRAADSFIRRCQEAIVKAQGFKHD